MSPELLYNRFRLAVQECQLQIFFSVTYQYFKLILWVKYMVEFLSFKVMMSKNQRLSYGNFNKE